MFLYALSCLCKNAVILINKRRRGLCYIFYVQSITNRKVEIATLYMLNGPDGFGKTMHHSVIVTIQNFEVLLLRTRWLHFSVIHR